MRNTKEVGWIFHHESSMICSNGGEALRVVLKKAFISSERSWQALDTPSSLQKMSQNQDFIRTPFRKLYARSMLSYCCMVIGICTRND